MITGRFYNPDAAKLKKDLEKQLRNDRIASWILCILATAFTAAMFFWLVTVVGASEYNDQHEDQKIQLDGRRINHSCDNSQFEFKRKKQECL
jgi:hypothetical protein